MAVFIRRESVSRNGPIGGVLDSKPRRSAERPPCFASDKLFDIVPVPKLQKASKEHLLKLHKVHKSLELHGFGSFPCVFLKWQVSH